MQREESNKLKNRCENTIRCINGFNGIIGNRFGSASKRITWSGLEPLSSLRLRRAMNLLAVGCICGLKYKLRMTGSLKKSKIIG